MVVDSILDRRAGVPWTVDGLKYMYDSAMSFGFDELARAIDSGKESDVKRELRRYVVEQGYNPDINKYVDSVEWLLDGI